MNIKDILKKDLLILVFKVFIYDFKLILNFYINFEEYSHYKNFL